MAKNSYILLFIFLFTVHFGLSGENTNNSLVEKVAKIYTNEIGVRELTGKNDGIDVEQYLSSVNLKQGAAWCAAFVSWCFIRAEINAVKSGWCPNWFQINVIYTRGENNNKVPKKADVFGIYFHEKERIAHVGFIDEWGEGSFCITVEGNTNDAGSREGDGVYRKRRLKNQIYKVSRWV